MNTAGLGLKALSLNIGATFGRQVAAAAFGLITTAIIARVFGPEGNGTLAVALLLPTMLATFLNLGVAPANVYHLGSAQITVRPLLRANLRIFALFAAAGLVVGAALLAWQAATLFPGVDPVVLWVALAAFPLALLNSYLQSVFQGLQQFRPYNLIAIAQPFLFLVLVAGLLLAGSREIALLIGAQVVSQLLVLLITLRMLTPLLGPEDSDEPSGKFIKKTLGYGWKAHLSNILAFANYKADVFLTNLFLGPLSVGVYVIAVAIAEQLWLISQAVSAVLLPRLSQLSADEDKRKRLTPLIARWVLVVTFLGSLTVAVIAGPIIALVFGPDFSHALLPLWILLPGIVLMSAARVLANDIAARGRPELNMYISVVVVVVNIVGNLILIPIYGLPGAAAATTIAYTLNLVLHLLIYSRFTGNRWVDSLFVRPSDVQLLWVAVLRHK